MRDPFANYDAWKTTDPDQDREYDDSGPDEMQMLCDELQSAQNKNALDAARINRLEAALKHAQEANELEDAYDCIRLMGAALRECRKHFEGTDPILKLIDEALS